MATVRAGARLHVGFCNLSLAHERLYGGIGVALAEPAVVVDAERAETVSAGDDLAAEYARRAVEVLGVPGASVTVTEALPRHVGLGSGTQLALSIYAAIARAHDEPVDVRSAAPALGRGGRSGVGVAGFERGGFVVDGGHSTTMFTADRPARGDWTVPPISARFDLPEHWRFVLAVPNGDRGRSGDEEDATMRSVVEHASPEIADQVAAVVVRRLLPAAAMGDRADFASAIAEIERLNGAWYAEEQGGVFRPPVGTIVESLRQADAVDAAGQSSWGPTVYGLTTAEQAGDAADAAREALADAGVEGDVLIARVAREGAQIGEEEADV